MKASKQKEQPIYERISSEITGRLAIKPAEAQMLYNYLAGVKGLHVDIGCLWGGTAILAALAGCKHVYTLDIMRAGYWESGDPETGTIPSCGAILDNFMRFGVAHKISVIKGRSDPWLIDVGIKPATVLIDGGHDYEAVKKDIENVTQVCTDYMFIHDYNSGGAHPGITKAIKEADLAEWELVDVVETLAVFLKRKD